MDQDRNKYNNEITPKKIQQEVDKTPHKLKVTKDKKDRPSERKSVNLINIAPINFRQILREKKKEKRESGGSGVDLELLKILDQQSEKIKNCSIILARNMQEDTKIQNQMTKAKIVRQDIRETFIQNKKVLKEQKEHLAKVSQTHELKKNLIDLEYEEKKNIYELTSKEEQLQQSIELAKEKIKKLNPILDQNLIYFTSVTEKVKEIQLQKKDLADALAMKKQALEEARHNYNMQQSQIFVLKIQTNSNLCSGMIYNKMGIDPKLLLEKDYIQWEKVKQKKLTFDDLKRFVLIQLCHGWKTMLRKLSYQSSQYQVLFGELKNEAVLEDLRRFLSYDKVRSSYKKSSKAIIFYSEAKVQVDRKQKILNLFKNFDNGIIRINNAQFTEFDGVFELEICYTYLNDCELKQRFAFEQHNYINKQKILKELKLTERRTFLLVQIPYVFFRQDLQRYDEVFELIRKKTGNMTASLKSK